MWSFFCRVVWGGWTHVPRGAALRTAQPTPQPPINQTQVFKLENYADATVFQDIVASTTGAVWSLTLSSPADVIKARVQRASLSADGEAPRGRDILRELLKKEGPLALFKGLTTKCLVIGPKLVMSFTIYSQLLARIDRALRGDEAPHPQAKQQPPQRAMAGTAATAATSPIKSSASSSTASSKQ